jgi:hypothetical protein
MAGEIERRMTLGRLLDHMKRSVQSGQIACAILEAQIREIDANRTEPLPVAREMITAVIEAAGNRGLTRADIISGIERDYGAAISPNTVTGTLLRMQARGLASRRGPIWFLET